MPGAQVFALQAGGSLVMLPGEGTVDPVYAGGGVMALASLAAILGVAGKPRGDRDVVEIYLHANAVETLPASLCRYDHGRRELLLVGREALGRRLAAASAEPGLVARAEALVFLVGRLEDAVAAEGERGYRNALMTAGRHAQSFDQAAETSGLWCQEIEGFYDREIDDLLALDGLSRSALCVIALGTAADG